MIRTITILLDQIMIYVFPFYHFPVIAQKQVFQLAKKGYNYISNSVMGQPIVTEVMVAETIVTDAIMTVEIVTYSIVIMRCKC